MSPSPVGELRDLLGASDKSEVAELEARVRELESIVNSWQRQSERIETIAADLPAVLERADAAGPEVNEALRPQVIEAVHVSSRTDPDKLAEALFPIMGKAVRMIIANMFNPQSSNKGFDVDEVFLIERLSGLPMLHVPRSPEAGTNSDVVAGMLEAIRSFVQDSFNATDFDGMRELSVGDVSVLVEWGPQAMLAVVVRGFPPETLRVRMQEILERVHSEHGEIIDAFEGDPLTLEPARQSLESLAIEADKKNSRRTLILAVLAVAAVVAVVVFALVRLWV